MNTITYNPFTHMSKGVKKLLATNFWQIVVLYIVTTILTVAGLIGALALIINPFVNGGDRPGVASIYAGYYPIYYSDTSLFISYFSHEQISP